MGKTVEAALRSGSRADLQRMVARLGCQATRNWLFLSLSGSKAPTGLFYPQWNSTKETVRDSLLLQKAAHTGLRNKGLLEMIYRMATVSRLNLGKAGNHRRDMSPGPRFDSRAAV